MEDTERFVKESEEALTPDDVKSCGKKLTETFQGQNVVSDGTMGKLCSLKSRGCPLVPHCHSKIMS